MVVISLIYPYLIRSNDSWDSHIEYNFIGGSGNDVASFVTFEAPGTGVIISSLDVVSSAPSFLDPTKGLNQSFHVTRGGSALAGSD